MAGQEGENKKMALSMQQNESPEPKRSKPMDITDAGQVTVASGQEFLATNNMLLQRELVAAAEEEQMVTVNSVVKNVETSESKVDRKGKSVQLEKSEAKSESPGMMLSVADANKIFLMTFGDGVTKDVLSQWSNQGIRFSADPKTSVVLVQHEGGPCGVLAAIQAFILKYLLFDPKNQVMYQTCLQIRLKEEFPIVNLWQQIFYIIYPRKKNQEPWRGV